MNTLHSSFNLFQPVAIGSDHAGFEYKEAIIQHLRNKGLHVKDFGPTSTQSVDYPDYAHPVAKAVTTGECGFGILLCGSANGVAMTANKHAGARAALCWNQSVAEVVRQHNNANIVCIPARFVSVQVALSIVDSFIQTDFEGGRHATRVNKISAS
jgi:ribose 5-phosphate isomerase B